MKRAIIEWPDGRLHEVSRPVEKESSKEIDALVGDLFETMYDAKGVGLSAIQIGVPLRVFVMDVGQGDPSVFVNPEIIKLQGKQVLVEEGCLSVPGIYAKVKRYPEIVIHAESETGLYATFLEGLEAQCFQHELEHLDGKLFVQKLPLSKREQIRKLLKLAKRRSK